MPKSGHLLGRDGILKVGMCEDSVDAGSTEPLNSDESSLLLSRGLFIHSRSGCPPPVEVIFPLVAVVVS